tara:strand:+ start:6914 stop:7564 length:651 start_codon:yes stop_codon:yes gene_type:complete
MTQYATGTIAVTNASAEITGTGTAWSTASVPAGAVLYVGSENVPYFVASVDAEGTIQLSAPYAGSTASGLSYSLTWGFSALLALPLLAAGDIHTVQLVTRALTILDRTVGGAVRVTSINSQTGTSYTAVIGDDGAVVEMNNASANTFTVPPNADVAFEIGATIVVVQMGAGATTIAPGSGVTLLSVGSLLDISAQYAAVTLYKRDTDEWLVLGAVA